MEPKIVVKKAFKLVGIEGETNIKNNRIPMMWDEFNPRAKEVKHWKKPAAFYGVCEYEADVEFTDETMFRELVSVEVTGFEDIPDGMVTREMPEQKYAVFTHRGSLKKIGETYDYIYKTWFPRSGYVFLPRDNFELYDERFDLDGGEDSEMDIYIPVK